MLGHSDISVTMNTYTHPGLEDSVEEMSRAQETGNAPGSAQNNKTLGTGNDSRLRGYHSVFSYLRSLFSME